MIEHMHVVIERQESRLCMCHADDLSLGMRLTSDCDTPERRGASRTNPIAGLLHLPDLGHPTERRRTIKGHDLAINSRLCQRSAETKDFSFSSCRF